MPIAFGIMKLLRKGTSLVLGTTALVTAAVGLIVFASAGAIDETIAHSREIERTFTSAVSFVEEWKNARGRLPSASEFVKWRSEQPEQTYGAQSLEFSTRDFPPEVTARFGSATDGGYLLTFWRGEWNEYYASWRGRSSLSFDPAGYFFLGSEWRDLIAFTTAATMLALGAIAIWPRRTSRSIGPRA